jgi:DNA-binding LacI/PurR family transcriptional regulator
METKKRVILKDVARFADVSVMTVSNVINGKFRHVTEKTRRKVESAIAELGYRPDLAGRSLKLARRFAIGMVIVDPSPTFIADAFTTNLVAGLSNHLSRQGYGLLLHGTRFDELSTMMMLRQSLVDGLCVFCSGPPRQRRAVYEQLAKHNEPIVIFQDKIDGEVEDALCIRQDDAGGAAMLAERVARAGAINLVFLTLTHRWPALDARERGIKQRLRRWPAAKLTVIAVSSPDFDSVQQALAAHIKAKGRPDAILAGNDQMAIAAQIWLIDQGIKVPGEVRVTGFNAFEFWRFARPALTTVESPAYAMGERGGREMLARLGAGAFATRDIVLPVTLQPGDSA